MPPSSTVTETNTCKTEPSEKPAKQYKIEIIWYNIFLLLFLHVIALNGAYLFFTAFDGKIFFFQALYGLLGGIGITAGAHRLWCHRSYKAKLPLRILLAGFISIAAETDIYVWCRDHRVHHKFTETDADPHNIKRGFFFAHMGWLMCRKHPDVTRKGKSVFLDDLMQDPVVRVQRRFHIPLCLFFAFLLPTYMEHVIFGAWKWHAFCHTIFRYAFVLNCTWLVNSAAHTFGDRPFDVNMAASESGWVSIFAQGEGWHNYHHVFPWDYSTSELGYTNNLTKLFIDFMALLGQAYDLKSASKKEVLAKKLKTGDGTRLDNEPNAASDKHAILEKCQ